MRRRKGPQLTALILGIAVPMAATLAYADDLPSSEKAEPAMKRGFAVGASMSATPMNEQGLFAAGFSLGYKIDRVFLAIGADGSRESGESAHSFDGSSKSEGWTTSFVVRSDVQITIVQGPGVELFGWAGVGMGKWTSRFGSAFAFGSAPEITEYTELSALRLELRAAPGIRWWVHPSFGANLSVGMEVDTFARLGSPAPDQLGRYPSNAASLLVNTGFLAVF